MWGSIVFLVLFAPVVTWQYRRYGDWNLRRLAGTLAGCLYATALVTYTWLPLPRRDPAWCKNHNLAVQLEPLMRIAEARDATAGKGLLGTLTDVTVMQLAFNVLLFVPLGVLLRGYWRRSLLVSCAAGLAISLLIEASQATGLWGLYLCPYRRADVDDLITNTAGALLGALLAPAVLWWMPNATLLRARRVQPRPVTSLRRWTGQLVDALLFAAVAAGVTLLAHVSATALGWPAGSMAVRLADGIGLVAAWVAVFVVPPWQNLAASPGQVAVWLTPIWPVGRAREQAARYVGEEPQAERDALEAARHGSLLRRLGRANVVALPMLLCALVALAWWSWFPLLVWPVLALASVGADARLAHPLQSERLAHRRGVRGPALAGGRRGRRGGLRRRLNSSEPRVWQGNIRAPGRVESGVLKFG